MSRASPGGPQSSGSLCRQHAIRIAPFSAIRANCRSPPPLPPVVLTTPVGYFSPLIPPDLSLASHQGYLSESKFCLGVSGCKIWALKTSPVSPDVAWLRLLAGSVWREGTLRSLVRGAWRGMCCKTALSLCPRELQLLSCLSSIHRAHPLSCH